MSVKIISTVWDQSRAEGAALLVLLALADHANDDGVSWPSVGRIAELARLDERRTQRTINQLIATGELYVLHKAGRGHTNLYLVTLGHSERTLLRVLTLRFEIPDPEARRLTYDILNLRDGEKVAPVTPITPEKVAPQTEKVTNPALKGGTGATRTVINRHLTVNEPIEDAHAREAEVWDQARTLLDRELPFAARAHLKDSVGYRVDEGTFEIRCTTPAEAEFMRLRLNGRVAEAMAQVLGRPIGIRYTSGNSPG